VYRAALSNEQIGQSPGALKESATDGNIYVDGIPGGQLAAINTDGDYIVGSIDYTGDTRGQAWYMDLLCLAKGAAELQSQAAINKEQLLNEPIVMRHCRFHCIWRSRRR
jgi:hypothetical protein